MEYLGSNAAASPQGVFVICRYLSGFDKGLNEGELRLELQALRTLATGSDDAAAVFTDSLSVASGLGIVGSDSKQRLRVVEDVFREGLRAEGDTWSWFRGRLLHRIAQRGLDQLEADGKLPDLVLALAWLLQMDPLNPLALDWGAGPEPVVRGLNFEAVANSTQWRGLQRWALALGLARRADVGNAKVLVADASTAIEDQIWALPADAPADRWLEELRRQVPMLGSRRILAQLPSGRSWDAVPLGLVLGLHKLEKAKRLALEPSDDGSHVVPIGLSTNPRQVGRILVRSER